jgi:flagellar biosynthetic protein FlhB
MAEEQQDPSEKTEQPTQKKLDDAHKKGDVAKSQEIGALFVLFAAALSIVAVAPWSIEMLARRLAGFMRESHAIPMDSGHLRVLFVQLSGTIALAAGIPMLVLAVAAIAGNMIQHRPVLSLEPLKPKFSKVSPLAGFKRLFSGESLVTFAKGLVKIVLVGAAIWLVIWPQRDKLDLMVSMDVAGLLGITRDLTLQLFAAVVAVMILVAGADFAYQRFKWLERQRMSMKELKEEFKQQEGSPEIKAKVRQLRQERARKRMMAEVPKATVVIMNPTHYAVALKYESGMRAPLCVAKGLDDVALRIRAVAEEAGVTVVEDPPLARVLHASVEIDEEIPEAHYKAVAQVIGYVMNLKGRRRWAAV